MYSSSNKDAGCPSQCMAENDYSSISGSQTCPLECMSGYANPSSSITCPSSCNYYETYSTIGGMYDMYIPASTKSRLIPPQSVTDDFAIQNDRITNFAGNVINVRETANLETGATTTNVLSLLSTLNNMNQQLIAAAKTSQNSAEIAKTAASEAPIVLQNKGPASTTININTASSAAQTASANASAATNLAAQITSLVNNIFNAIKGLPATPDIQHALKTAEASKSTASTLSSAANAAAEEANKAAVSAANVLTTNKEGFRFLQSRRLLPEVSRIANDATNKMVMHNRLRYNIGNWTGGM
jgi:hypothetical protein